MNKYETLSVIGEGAYGIVLRCKEKATGRTCAVKKFKDSDDNERVRKTTLREVKTLRLVHSHPNIVSMWEAFRRRGRLYLVFEFCEHNLLEVLEDKPLGLAPEDVRLYTFQLVHAIAWCHANGIIHRHVSLSLFKTLFFPALFPRLSLHTH